MTRSSRKKEKYGESSKLSEDNCTVGTAARTSPFSFDEIMLQRKHKKQPADFKEVIGGKLLGENISEKVSDAVESYRKRNKGSLHDDEKHAFEDSMDLNSRKKDEGKLFNVNDRESHRSERKSKTSPKRSSVVDRAKRGLIDEQDYGKRKSNKYNDSQKEPDRRHSRHITEDIHADRYRGNTEQEAKRKRRNEDDRKDKDRNAVKKHDSYKGSEPKPKEKREKKEPSKVLNEDSRLKRRRSRSRECANDTGRRSISLSSRAHKVKHVSHAVRDHEELSGHSSKDRRKRSNPDFNSPEPKEERENKEQSEVLNEDSRLKKRLSRSRGRTKDTGRRSISLSPRAHKHASHAVQDHGELSVQSSKDRSGRSNSDFDSARMSSNGFSGHHRCHGNSASKLGGYSPRKRRTESAAKTPSPTIRSPEKRSAGWESESSFNGSVFSNLQSSAQIVSANIPHVSMTVPGTSNTAMIGVGVMSTASSPRGDTFLDSIQLTQATRPSRRLYVENLPTGTSEESVIKCINNFILSSGGHHVQGTHPCISCIINKEKNQALVEFLTPEDASAALSLDGRTFKGSILKVRRPKDYFDASTGIPRKSVSEVGSISKMVKDSPHKVSQGMGIDAPITISSKKGDYKNVFQKINLAAEHPRPSIPKTDVGKRCKQYHQLANCPLPFETGALKVDREERKKSVWMTLSTMKEIFSEESQKESQNVGGALCIDPSGILLTSIIATCPTIVWEWEPGKNLTLENNPSKFKVSALKGGQVREAILEEEFVECGVLLYRIKKNYPSERFDFVDLESVGDIELKKGTELYGFIHDEGPGFDFAFRRGYNSYPIPPSDVPFWKSKKIDLMTYNEHEKRKNTRGAYRTLYDVLSPRLNSCDPTEASIMFSDVPLLQVSQLGLHTYCGQSGCPVFKREGDDLLGLVLLQKKCFSFVLPVNVLRHCYAQYKKKAGKKKMSS